MKIAWVTPFNTRSAIARVSAAVTSELVRRGHEVVIVRSEADPYDPTPEYVTELKVFRWRDWDPRQLDEQFDAVVLNIGDNYGFHAGVIDLARHMPCVGIFHDYCIYHLFAGWLEHHGHSVERRNQEVDLVYGRGVVAIADRAFSGLADLSFIAANLPMTEWMSRWCGAALAHSSFYVPRLQSSCPGPVRMAHLTFEPRNVAAAAIQQREEIVLATVGWMNANKCADLTIEALAASPALRTRCRYRLVGPIAPTEHQRLLAVAERCGFDRIDFVGEVDDATLDAELANADILVCLRRPVIEGASASAIEAMMSGRPVIVADAGFYGDLPSDMVVKVPAEIPVPALTKAIEALAQDEARRLELGERARAWSLEEFSVERYASGVEALLADFVDVKPTLATVRHLGFELDALGLTADDPAVERIAGVMQDLFSSPHQASMGA